MADRGNWRTMPSPDNPLANRHGGQQDPRRFGRGYSPDFPSDISLLEDVFRRIAADGTVPLDEIIRRLVAYNVPPQVAQHAMIAQIAVRGPAGAVELLPKNPDRVSMIVANFGVPGDTIVMTFDAPALAGTVLPGIPIAAQGTYQESNGSVSVNSVWVGTNAAAPTLPILVLAYEGMLSIAGNKRFSNPGPGG